MKYFLIREFKNKSCQISYLIHYLTHFPHLAFPLAACNGEIYRPQDVKITERTTMIRTSLDFITGLFVSAGLGYLFLRVLNNERTFSIEKSMPILKNSYSFILYTHIYISPCIFTNRKLLLYKFIIKHHPRLIEPFDIVK